MERDLGSILDKRSNIRCPEADEDEEERPTKKK